MGGLCFWVEGRASAAESHRGTGGKAPSTQKILQFFRNNNFILRAKSTDRDKLTANKLTTKRRFRYSDFVTDFVTK